MHKRGSGYCTTEKCEKYAKPVFFLNAVTFYCDECRERGHLEPERSDVTGTGPFTEVRVEFGYNLRDGKYHCVAVVRDQAAPPGRVYTRFSSMVSAVSTKRATKSAENLLAVLQQSEPEEDKSISFLHEGILNIDDDDFSARLKELAVGWRARGACDTMSARALEVLN